jgi:hypothetical protein
MRLVPTLILALALASRAIADPVEVELSAQVEASAERVLAVLTNFEAWGSVFVSVETLHAERQDPFHARVRQKARRAGHTLAYTLVATIDPGARRVDLALDPTQSHDLDVLETTWRIHELPDGGSRIELHVVTDSGLPVPGFIERAVAEGTARSSLDELVVALHPSF